MCAGVGKTYTMLQAAHAEKLKNSDIVIGYVETHNRTGNRGIGKWFRTDPA